MPRPAFSCAVAAAADEDRSGWLMVGVVGEPSGLSWWERETGGLRLPGLSESPRAGRSTTALEPKEDSELSGESDEPKGGEDVNADSITGRLRRLDIMLLETLRCCC